MKGSKVFIYILIFLFGMTVPAEASRCPGAQANASFGASFYNAATLTGFLYDTDYDTLYVSLPNGTWIAYQNFPLSQAYLFAPTTTPDYFYKYQVIYHNNPVYPAALETDVCLQLATEKGTIITVN